MYECLKTSANTPPSSIKVFWEHIHNNLHSTCQNSIRNSFKYTLGNEDEKLPSKKRISKCQNYELSSDLLMEWMDDVLDLARRMPCLVWRAHRTWDGDLEFFGCDCCYFRNRYVDYAGDAKLMENYISRSIDTEITNPGAVVKARGGLLGVRRAVSERWAHKYRSTSSYLLLCSPYLFKPYNGRISNHQ